ncbi:MAG: hypothetical protein AAF634_16950, partial [Bacteroidota bacterium]
MRRNLLYPIVVLLVFSCISRNPADKKAIELSNWEFKMVSRGANQPDFRTSADSIQYIPILLHQGFTTTEIKQFFKWNEEEFKAKLDNLVGNDFLVRKGMEYVPSVMVISETEALGIREELKPIAESITTAIAEQMDSIQIKTRAISCFSKFEFEDLSLLVLSNVLLDSGQLGNIEREYLKKKRPLRKGKRYYASYQQKGKAEFEALGIYGNQIQMHSGFALCRYGNQRYNEDVLNKNAQILADYKKQANSEIFDFPIISNSCDSEIQGLADYFLPFLLKIVEDNTLLLVNSYQNSQYATEISFE